MFRRVSEEISRFKIAFALTVVQVYRCVQKVPNKVIVGNKMSSHMETMVENVTQQIKKSRRKRVNKKKNQQKLITVASTELPSIQSVHDGKTKDSDIVNTTTTNPVENKVDRLRQKLGQLKAKRTGVARRHQVSAYKESQEAQGKKPKNAMRNIAREGIHELMGKLGIQDSKIESEIMNEIVRGKLRTPTQVAEYVVQKLQQRYPNGPKSTKPSGVMTSFSQSSSSSPPSNVTPPPPILTNQPDSTQHPSQSSRKPLKPPNPSLMVRPQKS